MRRDDVMSLFFSSQGRPLSFKTFLIWVLISIYQGKNESVSDVNETITRLRVLHAAAASLH